MEENFKVVLAALEKAQSRGVFTLQEVSTVIHAYNELGRQINELSAKQDEKKPNKKN